MAKTFEPAAVTGETTAPVLEVRGLTTHYAIGRVRSRKVVEALNEIDLTVEKGEVLGVVGESGSGKTTFARTVAFLDRPTSGEILVGGERTSTRPGIRELRRHRRQVQMIFQDPYSSLDPLHSVRYSVRAPLRAFGIVRRQAEHEEVERLLTQVGLSPAADFVGRYPHELSGGQRQRVGIARALAARPSLILADEPTSMLDVSIRLTIMNLLLDLQRSEGLSLVFITHDLGGAYYMSDRIAIMYAGRIQEIGPAAEVLSNPRHPYTQLLREAAPDPEHALDGKEHFEGKGDPPDLTALPPGCSFAPRCPYVRDECRQALPQLVEVGPSHRVRCVLYA